MTSDLENVRFAWSYWVGERDLNQLGKILDGLWLLSDRRAWYHSAIDLARNMLAVLASYPATVERTLQEILLQTSLARALLVIKGYTAEVEQAYTRALELSQSATEGWYLRVLENACQEGALMLELRAALRLHQPWMRQGRLVEGKKLVEGLLGRFTESFSTVDVREAISAIGKA